MKILVPEIINMAVKLNILTPGEGRKLIHLYTQKDDSGKKQNIYFALELIEGDLDRLLNYLKVLLTEHQEK